MKRATAAEYTRRINIALRCLKQRMTPGQVATQLSRRWGLSRRQAFRYARLARSTGRPLKVPSPKVVFTVKLPVDLLRQVRRHCRREDCALSDWVTQALRRKLPKTQGHG